MPSKANTKEIGSRHLLNMSGFSTIPGPEGEERVYYFGDDKKGWNLRTEIRGTLLDSMRGDEPTTILGILMRQPMVEIIGRRESLDMEALAKMAGRTAAATEAIVDQLAEEELAITLVENGVEQVMGFAPYTKRNETKLPSPNEAIALKYDRQ